MKIGTRLYLGIGFAILISIIWGGLTYSKINKLSNSTENMHIKTLKISNAAGAIKSDMYALFISMENLVRAEGEEQINKEISAGNFYTKRLLENFETIITEIPTDSKSIELAYEAFLTTKDFRTKIIDFIKQEKKQNITELINNTGKTYLNYMISKTEKMIIDSKERSEIFLTANKIEREKVLLFAGIGMTIVLLLALGSAIFITRGIVIPLNIIVQRIRNLSKGDLKETVNIYSKNEIGLLADSFRDLQKDLIQRTSLLDQISSGDFSTDIFPRSEKDDLGKSFYAMTSTLRNTTAELQESEEKYRNLIEMAADGVLIFQKGKIVYSNKQSANILGYDINELLGINFLDLVISSEQTKITEMNRLRMQGKTVPIMYETIALLKNGETKDIEINSGLIIYEKEQATLTFIRDISKRKESEELLQSYQQRLAHHLANTPLAVIDWNKNFEVSSWNKAAEHIFGYSSNEAMGKNAGELINSSDIDIEKIKINLINGKTNTKSTNENITKEGKIILCEWYNTPILDNKGSFVGSSSLVMDITERTRVETALKREAAFTSLLQKIASTANESPTIEAALQVCLDEVCTLMDWPIGHVYMPSNDETGALMPTKTWHLKDPEKYKSFIEATDISSFKSGIGLPGRIFESKRPSWITNVNKDPGFLRTELIKELRLKAAFGFPVILENEVVAVLEFFAKIESKPDFKLLEVMANIGKQLGQVVERTRSEEKLKEAVIDAESANKAKSLFLANMSHELRTPLNAILGFSQVLQLEKESLNSEQLENIGFIRESGEHLLEMVSDILDLSKIESGKMDIIKESFNLGDMLNRFPASIQAIVDKKDIKLEVDIDSSIGKINADEKRIKEILYNLLSNAIKFTNSGRTVGIKAYIKQKQAIIEIWDQGRGIDSEDIEKIFDPFEQVGKAKLGNSKGTGLGLAITKKLIEAHNGTISVKSEKDKGSRFTVTIPYKM